ncbi:hypothetical protein LEMA_P106460.1 [Plenodomus lingam JN3]|uniref:SCA7 domain-containing protein n=2 Tax=Leptosphaeria maculans TaxID=5022 RepID=E5A159_LEPMJ|nr:hypothetical protein LEMA_P106460.1 [Plenodomus lingam JN3]CBX97515.1 hypothetical protein LEMA_P106460.1 [Plenodomus lingam JN3]
MGPEKTGKRKVLLRIKKPVPKPSIAGNWKESDATNVDKSVPPVTSPIVNPLDEKTITGFPSGRPLDDKVDTVQCKHCRRPVLRAASATHIRDCLNKKQEKLKKKKEAKEAKDAALRKEKGEDDDGLTARKSAVKGAVVDGDGAKKGKKRKLDGDADKAPNAKKKKKDEPKVKGAKPKGPVDVEKQCGVPLPNGGFCARSLTCKSHSMGLKRAVPGRSLPYDMLLAQYQKKSQARQQRAAIDANAPLPEDIEPSGDVDSDEEKDGIMAALSRYRPTPSATHIHIPQRFKYQHIRMKGLIRSALGAPPGGGGSIFSGMGMGLGLGDGMGSSRGGLGLGMMGAPASASQDRFPDSAGLAGFGPLSAGLDGGTASRRPSAINVNGGTGTGGGGAGGGGSGGGGGGGPRQILPGQLPGPGQARKSSVGVGGVA